MAILGMVLSSEELQQRFLIFATGNLFLLSTTATSIIQVFTKTQQAKPWQWFFLDPEAGRAVVYLIPWAITLLIFLLIYRFEP